MGSPISPIAANLYMEDFNQSHTVITKPLFIVEKVC